VQQELFAKDPDEGMQEHLRVDMHPAEADTIVNHLIPWLMANFGESENR